MLTLDFTDLSKTSTKNKGFFDRWNNLFSGYGYYDEYLEEGEELSETLTTTGNRSLASYFNTSKNLNRKTKWIFGNGDKRIEIESLELETEEGDESGIFNKNIFDLGNGLNYFDLSLDFDSDETSDSIKNQISTKGYSCTILGGSAKIALRSAPGKEMKTLLTPDLTLTSTQQAAGIRLTLKQIFWFVPR